MKSKIPLEDSPILYVLAVWVVQGDKDTHHIIIWESHLKFTFQFIGLQMIVLAARIRNLGLDLDICGTNM